MASRGNDFAAILRALTQHQVRFITVGGVSAVLQGAPVTTFDLDIVHSRARANCLRLATALASLDALYRGHSKAIRPTVDLLQSKGHHLLLTIHGPLDVLGSIGNDHDYRQLSKATTSVEVMAGVSIKVLRLSMLIQIKQETARAKDRAVLAILRQTLAEQDAQSRKKK